MFKVFLSQLGMINLVPLLSESSPKEKDSELLKEWCVSYAHADWLIVGCQSILSNNHAEHHESGPPGY